MPALTYNDIQLDGDDRLAPVVSSCQLFILCSPRQSFGTFDPAIFTNFVAAGEKNDLGIERHRQHCRTGKSASLRSPTLVQISNHSQLRGYVSNWRKRFRGQLLKLYHFDQPRWMQQSAHGIPLVALVITGVVSGYHPPEVLFIGLSRYDDEYTELFRRASSSIIIMHMVGICPTVHEHNAMPRHLDHWLVSPSTFSNVKKVPGPHGKRQNSLPPELEYR
ncbi:hypothetical protein F5880DRAFT_1502717 [Lentinula raphanica]|nr:hypothetical protein F5880DRAFT_1502717 [Lentinula raphanica]